MVATSTRPLLRCNLAWLALGFCTQIAKHARRTWAYLAVSVAEREGKGKESLLVGCEVVPEGDMEVVAYFLIVQAIPARQQRVEDLKQQLSYAGRCRSQQPSRTKLLGSQ